MKEDQVRHTRAWRQFHKGKPRPFLKILGGMDLATLLEICDEMGWFSKNRIPQQFRNLLEQHFGRDTADKLYEFVPRTGQLSAVTSRDARNRLHPAKCVREPFQLSEVDGIYASVCMMLALTSFVEQLTDYTSKGR
jgi:hypothetical protein